MTLDAFGPNLRRIRLQRGIAMAHIVETTNIAPDLLEALERNDFDEWPTGLFARAYVRQYASALGLDPASTVDEFCRHFPHGDRRAEGLLRERAALMGHNLQWRDDVEYTRRAGDRPEAAGSDERTTSAPEWLMARLRRLMPQASQSPVVSRQSSAGPQRPPEA